MDWLKDVKNRSKAGTWTGEDIDAGKHVTIETFRNPKKAEIAAKENDMHAKHYEGLSKKVKSQSDKNNLLETQQRYENQATFIRTGGATPALDEKMLGKPFVEAMTKLASDNKFGFNTGRSQFDFQKGYTNRTVEWLKNHPKTATAIPSFGAGAYLFYGGSEPQGSQEVQENPSSHESSTHVSAPQNTDAPRNTDWTFNYFLDNGEIETE